MGTQFKIIIYTTDQKAGQLAIQAAFERIEQLNRICSDYLPESELNTFSNSAGTGQKVKLSPDLMEILQHSKKFARQTKGSFDVTIGPLSKLWRRAFRQQVFPKEESILKNKALVNHKYLRLYPKKGLGKLKKKGSRYNTYR